MRRFRGKEIPGRAGFCRAEFLMIGGVLLIVAGMVVPLWAVGITRARIDLVENDTLALVDAMERYRAENNRLPLPVAVQFGDIRFGTSRYGNRMVLNILRGVEGPGNYRNENNPNQTVYNEVAPYEEWLSGLNPKGEFLDVWGHPCQVVMVMDTDGDGDFSAEHSRYERIVKTGFAVWSLGPDGTEDTDDDIRSWTLRQP